MEGKLERLVLQCKRTQVGWNGHEGWSTGGNNDSRMCQVRRPGTSPCKLSFLVPWQLAEPMPFHCSAHSSIFLPSLLGPQLTSLPTADRLLPALPGPRKTSKGVHSEWQKQTGATRTPGDAFRRFPKKVCLWVLTLGCMGEEWGAL